MRAADIAGMALTALAQQRSRTALSVVGVAIGTFALALSLSVGQGVRVEVDRQFRANDQLRRIQVSPAYGVKEEATADEPTFEGVSDPARRARLRKAHQRHREDRGDREPKARLTAETLHDLARLEHVAAVTPVLTMPGCRATFGSRTLEAGCVSVVPGSRSLADRLIAGRPIARAGGRGVLVHEYLLYQWGIVNDQQIRAVVGRPIRLEYHRGGGPAAPFLVPWLFRGLGLSIADRDALERALTRLPEALEAVEMEADERDALTKAIRAFGEQRNAPEKPVHVVEEFTIGGVIREAVEGDPEPGWGNWMERDADIILPPAAAAAFYFRDPRQAEDGLNSVVVQVDREESVPAVVKALKGRGFDSFSLAEIIRHFRANVTMITFATAFIAVVALAVAAVGITNTMIMSVLERTREIGVMKAVGARDRHVQALFLIEGGLLGLIGGALGMLAAWAASFPGDAIARALVAQQAEGAKLEHSVFAYPDWLVLGVPALAVAVTILAAAYPARRAVRVDPITSLRHE